MSTLAFFPWLQMSSGVTVGGFELIPYVSDTYAGPDAAAVAAILRPYEEVAGLSVREATLLRIQPGGLTDDLTEAQIGSAFTFAQMLSFAGLAQRRFFEHSGYCNHDNFQLIVQRYDDPTRGVGVVTRRRDGSTRNLVTASVHRVPCPDHVHRSRVAIDIPLLTALNACTAHANADEFIDAMLTFNMANTDSSAMSPHVELVLSAGAFERVFGLRNANHNELANAFTAAIVPRSDIARDDCARLRRREKYRKSPTVRDVWIRDLFSLRGDLAHGKVGPEYPSIWSMQEHLLLAAYVFPFVMKVRLASSGLYTLTDRDRDGIEAFEHLACAENLFAAINDPDENTWYQWNDVLANVPPDPAKMAEVGRLLQALITPEPDGSSA